MRSAFASVALPLLLLVILDGSLPSLLPAISVKAFPAAVTTTLASIAFRNKTVTNQTNYQTSDTTVEVTEYPVFISVTEETQSSPESEVVTETYMIVENQEMDDDDDSSGSSTTPIIVKPTTPMPSPKSSPEQEEVLRELKKLWDLSEGIDTGNELKSSLSSIVHLAYARVYIESDETLLKLKYLLKQLQERLLQETNFKNGDNSHSSGEAASPLSYSTESNSTNSSSSGSTIGMEMTTMSTTKINEKWRLPKKRKKRSLIDGYDDEIDAIFFANVNSKENAVLPEEKDHYYLPNSHEKTKPISTPSPYVHRHPSLIKNNITANLEPLDRTLVSVGTVSSSSVLSMSTTPSSTAIKKIVHINDRKKPMPSFYLTPEKIKELKNRATSSTTSTSTLSPISIMIEDELENEVNLLQQQQHVDTYDIHISSSETLVPLTTATPLNASIHTKPLSGESTKTIRPSSTTESPFTAEDIALALFQLLRPDTFSEEESDEKATVKPHPTPSNILYQVSSLSSVLNFTLKAENISSTSTTTASPATVPNKMTTTKIPLSSTMASVKPSTTVSILKLKQKYFIKNKNSTYFVPAPPALSDWGYTTSTVSTTSTERRYPAHSNNDIYDYTDVVDQKPAADHPVSVATNIVQGTQESVQQMVDSLTRLSVGAKMVLLFSVSISILSIGFGLYALGPPLAGVGVLGIIIPIGLLLLFETSASSGKRKLTTRQREQLLINKLQSEEFSKILDMIFDAVIKYSKG